MCHTCSLFSSFEELLNHEVHVGNKFVIPALGRGNISLPVRMDGNLVNVTFLDVLYMPDLMVNLISVSVAQKQVQFIFGNDLVLIVLENKLMVIAELSSSGLFHLFTSDLYWVLHTKKNRACDHSNFFHV